MSHHGQPRRTNIRTSRPDDSKPRLLNPSPSERNWVRKMPDIYPDILRAPAVTYRSDRDDPRIKANRYVAFVRPYRGKQGLLLIGHDTRPCIIDETQPDRVSILPMRLDREAISEPWVFAASIYGPEGLVQLEDCVVANGECIRSTKPYKDRFAAMERFCASSWYPDIQFQCGWQISVVVPSPIGVVRSIAEKAAAGCLCLMPDIPTYRLLKVVPRAEGGAAPPTTGPTEFLCFPELDKPDVYNLRKADGSEAGRASVQSLSMSMQMAQKRATEKSWAVMAEWDTDFEAYVVASIL